ncbi:hypothetical protein DXH95_03615 [Sphingorhabdus pulchriflava]|uniref:Uncharacterized protein n=2 Tax=Sphingorhabdus pulchriflava TaxID=2292257 RepID=A0A371BFZ7_9SPHN|nr:hypothetical protein DXH95_03615 [Sphingorhabdus pulchriflava]
MTLAMKRLKNIGWLALVFATAVLLYPLSLNVAALHSDLAKVNSDILETEREIRFLQAEIRTRASVAQLEEWNSLLYGYAPPSAEQFIDGERGLASLGGQEQVVKPVMVAVNDIDGVAPAGEIGTPGGAPSLIVDEKPANREQVREVKVALATTVKASPEPVRSAPKGRTERLASIDDKLLSDSVLREIQSAAEKENRRK